MLSASCIHIYIVYGPSLEVYLLMGYGPGTFNVPVWTCSLGKEMIGIWWHGETCRMDSDVPVFYLKIRLCFDIEMYNERTFNYGTNSYVIE